MTDDIVVVGGRCAGAPTAMLLARAGLSVRLLERSPRLRDVVSGHLIKPSGVARLRRWGLLDALLATGCPQLDERVLWLAGRPRHSPAAESGTGPITPRRTVLDPILLSAAAAAGVTVEMGVSVDGLLRVGDRVTGVTTSAGERRARLVIGADGRNSRIARLAGAGVYRHHPPVTFAYYTYWRGSPVAGVHAWLEPGRFFGVFPVGHGLTLAFVQAPSREYDKFRGNFADAYSRELRSRPGLADLLGDAVIAEPLRGTAALPTFFRTASGRGWALVGDAGHHKDPLIALGIADAFRDADLVAAAVSAGWPGDLDAALAEYGRVRDHCSIPLSDANLGVARLDMTAEALGAAWLQMSLLEQALQDLGCAGPLAASTTEPTAQAPDRCDFPPLPGVLPLRSGEDGGPRRWPSRTAPCRAGTRRRPVRTPPACRTRGASSSMTSQPPSDAELAELAGLAARATPGPWHVRHLDDDHAMSLVAVSTEPDTGLGERWPDFDHATMIAATLVQQPRYVDIADERWDVNATFIAAARTAVPRLLAEITRLRNLLDNPPNHKS